VKALTNDAYNNIDGHLNLSRVVGFLDSLDAAAMHGWQGGWYSDRDYAHINQNPFHQCFLCAVPFNADDNEYMYFGTIKSGVPGGMICMVCMYDEVDSDLGGVPEVLL
jgi:hypothetical protein